MKCKAFQFHCMINVMNRRARKFTKTQLVNPVPVSDITDIDELQRRFTTASLLKRNATTRKGFLEDAMHRHCAQAWDAKKKQRMVRRYVASDNVIMQNSTLIDELQHRLQEIKGSLK